MYSRQEIPHSGEVVRCFRPYVRFPFSATLAGLVVLIAPPGFSATYTVDDTADASGANPGDLLCADAMRPCERIFSNAQGLLRDTLHTRWK